jgi:hypothetical protein
MKSNVIDVSVVCRIKLNRLVKKNCSGQELFNDFSLYDVRFF